MKFNYQYRTSDNKPHEGVVYAASRDAAYSTLRAQGIKPVRVEEAPGVFNKLLGKGKRWTAIVVLLVAAVSSLVFALTAKRRAVSVVSEVYASMSEPADRHQIYGDPALMERLEREDFQSVFPDVGDRYLAHFAQPGVVHRFEDELWRVKMAQALASTLSAPLEVSLDEDREIREIKQIVLGIRQELKDYLADGVGTCSTFVKRMEERQIREAQIFSQAKLELQHETDPNAFERVNKSLRTLGIRTIMMPESATGVGL